MINSSVREEYRAYNEPTTPKWVQLRFVLISNHNPVKLKYSGQLHLVYTVVHTSYLSLNQIDSGFRANNWTTSVSEMQLPNIIVKLLLCLVVHIIYLSSIGTLM